MGIDSDAILAYGYDFGEDFGIQRPWAADWISDDESCSDAVARVLFEAAGRKIEPGAYFNPDDLKEACGVELVRHNSDRCIEYILAAVSQRAYRGCPKGVDLKVSEPAYRQLQWALGVLRPLGIEPKADHPQWLLASWWSR